ncbi:hypothetical protein FSP39_021677 [Pinctada imbricata]|uniref:Mitochondria-eating protein C-terminal domain-containing protein n=1 Tax=Pinctada imbricata TaxID=66713 RepID=A0AA89C5S6_PINIB|nr:hypothetical protein FSP39_021677 [Pinctada imbricata]
MELDQNKNEKETMTVNGKKMKGEIMTNSIYEVKGKSYNKVGNAETTNLVDKLNEGESKVGGEIPTGNVPSTSSVVENKNETANWNGEPNAKSRPSEEDGQRLKNHKVQKDGHTDICENRNEASVSVSSSSQDPLTCLNEGNLAETVKLQTAYCKHDSDGNTSAVAQKVENSPEKDGCFSNSDKSMLKNAGPREQSGYCKRCEAKDFVIQQLHDLYTEVNKRSEKLLHSKEKQNRNKIGIHLPKKMKKFVRGKSRETSTEFYDDVYDHPKETEALQEICFLTSEFEKMSSISKSLSSKSPVTFVHGSEETIKELRSKIEDFEEKLEAKTTICQALNEKCDVYERERRELERLRTERDNAIKAKEEALTRLSKVAAGKLRDDNPAITDLSDEDRPLNLAEKFSELYDNEWTDFYDDLAGKGKDDKEVVIDLLGLVRTIYEYCKTEKGRQVENLKNFGIDDDQDSADELDDDDDSDQLKQIENTRLKRRKITRFLKSTRTFSLDVLKRKMKSGQVLPDVCDPMSKPCKKYVEKCMRLCWLMHIQDRQIVLLFEFDRDKPFSTDVYRHFTKVGKMGDYLVWPPMFLYEGGPLLQKGVIQPQ